MCGYEVRSQWGLYDVLLGSKVERDELQHFPGRELTCYMRPVILPCGIEEVYSHHQ